MGSTGFSDGRGCSNRWLKKWFLSALWLRRTMQGKVLNWRGIVVDSAIGGRKNGSPLSVLPCGFVGLCRGRILPGLGWSWILQSVADKMVDLCHVDDFALAWDGSGFCNRWLKKWFVSLSAAPWIRGRGLGEILSIY